MTKVLVFILSLICVLTFFSGCGSNRLPNGFYNNDLYSDYFYNNQENLDHPEDLEADNINIAKVGDIIKFGRWEQDGNFDNGEEEIEWIVLEVSNNKYLALSKYALAGEVYSYDGYQIFEDSDVAEFLNGVFYEDAFNYPEEKKLVTGTITSKDGNYTPKDKVFLLSSEEIQKYAEDISNIYDCYPTQEAKDYMETKEDGDDQGKCYWWVRDNSLLGTILSPDGVGFVIVQQVNKKYGIRPAIWLDFNYKTKISKNTKISNEFLGKWYVTEGADKHTLTIFENGKLSFEDNGLLEYVCYSSTEIATEDGEYVFVLEEDEMIRYEEDNPEDVYVYKKQ